MSGQLIVPIALWGNEAPTHTICCLSLTQDLKVLVTGSSDGHICLWDVDPAVVKTGVWGADSIVPRSLLFGHSSAIMCLVDAPMGSNSDINVLVSCSDSGEMCTWDLSDGRCLESVRMQYVHTSVQPHLITGHETSSLFCNGYYSEIQVISLQTLDILYSLSSRLNPDWISAMYVCRPPTLNMDMVIGLSLSGVMKMWTLSGHETRSSEPIFENESKQIRCLNPLRMTCCAFNLRTILVTCTKYWQVYDAHDFALLCHLDVQMGERIVGGEFVAADRVLIWTDGGRGLMYQLPTNCIPDSGKFHSQSVDGDDPILVNRLEVSEEERHLTSPVSIFSFLPKMTHTPTSTHKVMLRGDSNGRITLWSLASFQDEKDTLKDAAGALLTRPAAFYSLQKSWDSISPSHGGIFDPFVDEDGSRIKITSSVYLPLKGLLVCGREDGTIINVSATYIILDYLLQEPGDRKDFIPHQILEGHSGRVTCLLYPHHSSDRYDQSFLLSGGVDFSVCLWDIFAGSLLYRFSVHAGEVTQLCVPPLNCTKRVSQSICSIASDHSVALLSLKERKCLMLASRHRFPIQVIKWRPLDDFIMVGCVDGSVHVWQMETGHLDRIIHGITAEDIMNACDEHTVPTSGDKLSNPAIHFLRGVRHRNLAAIKHAAARGISHLGQQAQTEAKEVIDITIQSRSHPLMIQGLKANPKDQDCHVLFFDLESMVVNMLTDEYATLSQETMESQGLTLTSDFERFAHLAKVPGEQNKLTGMFNKLNSAVKGMQDRADGVSFKPGDKRVSLTVNSKDTPPSKKNHLMPRKLVTMETARIILSLLHAWGLDQDLDRVCQYKLGLLKPQKPVCFGLLAKSGHMCLLLPTLIDRMKGGDTPSNADAASVMQRRAARFSCRHHWLLSRSLTTNHLLSVISLANTLMSMTHGTFLSLEDRTKKGYQSIDPNQDIQQMKQGWSLLATLHCVHLPDLLRIPAPLPIRGMGQDLVAFKGPMLDQLSRRWQDRCLEIREAAQALLLAELRRLGVKGRKQLVEEWGPFLPCVGEGTTTLGTSLPLNGPGIPERNPTSSNNSVIMGDGEGDSSTHSHPDSEDELTAGGGLGDEDGSGGQPSRRTSSILQEDRRKQMTAVILLGVVGAQYGLDMTQTESTNPFAQDMVITLDSLGSSTTSREDRRKSMCIDGNYARQTGVALSFLLLAKPSRSLPLHTPFRRAAIDLIGRGFPVWQMFLDVSKVLLALLELCCDPEGGTNAGLGDGSTPGLVPSMSFGLPLTPSADSARTARHAISLIATANPAVFITTLSKEISRFNHQVHNPNSMAVNLPGHVLVRAKAEILRNVQSLMDKMPGEVGDLIIDTVEIVLHSLDLNHLKTKGLMDVFPAFSRFPNVSYCGHSKRIAVGSRSGQMAMFNLKTPHRPENMSAHSHPVTCCSFSPDGKNLASYSMQENKMCFWSTATSMFGLGTSQTKCVRTYNTPPFPYPDHGVSVMDPIANRSPPRLIWVNHKALILMFGDKSEFRYSL